MRYVAISIAKNNLSTLLREVQQGESIVITDRGTPVARLEPISSRSDSARVQALIERGVVRAPLRQPSATLPPPVQLPPGVSVVAALLEDREEGR